MSAFVEAAVAAGPSKASRVAQALRQAQEKYDPRRFYWGPLRNGIIRLHETNSDPRDLDQLLNGVDVAKKENYRKHIAGYKKFLSKNLCQWMGSPQGGRCHYQELVLRVNADLALRLGSTPHLVRLHFKQDTDPRLSKNRAAAMAALIAEVSGDKHHVGILDVRQGKLSIPKIDKRIMPWLRAEAASFISLWHELEDTLRASGS